MKTESLIGRVFGRLSVVSKGGKSKDGRIIWHCLCQCGKEKSVTGTSLRIGRTRSCGCISAEMCRKNVSKAVAARARTAYLGKNVSVINFLYSRYKRRAVRGKIVFEIERNKFEQLIGSVCFYCGGSPSRVAKISHLKHGDTLRYNGIDRVDSSGGYISDNVVPCCWMCNRAKASMGKEMFEKWAVRIGDRAHLWCSNAKALI